jgi:uncharacterized membrane protein
MHEIQERSFLKPTRVEVMMLACPGAQLGHARNDNSTKSLSFGWRNQERHQQFGHRSWRLPWTQTMPNTQGMKKAIPPPRPSDLSPALERNLKALTERRRTEEGSASLQDRVADIITGFAGSMTSIYLHGLIFGFWIVANIGVLGLAPWDPSLVILAMIASVEAIFLSTFVMISQNRMDRAARRRAELDLQTNLLSEYEITRVVNIVSAVAKHLGVETAVDHEVPELARDIAPETILDKIEEADPEA